MLPVFQTQAEGEAYFRDPSNYHKYVNDDSRMGSSMLAVFRNMGWNVPASPNAAVAPSAPTTPTISANGHSTRTEVAVAVRESVKPSQTASASEQVGEAQFIDPLPMAPASLKALRQWVRWKLEDVHGRPTKVPYRVDGAKAASTRPADWTDYETACKAGVIDNTQGIGFVVDGGIVGVDLDGCRNPETEEVAEWAEKIIDTLNSYTEITPSQTGLRVWVRGTLPGTDKVFNLDPSCGYGSKVKIEVYTDSRYFTVTGDSFFVDPCEVEERDLTQAYKLFHDLKAKYPAPKSAKASTADAVESTQIEWLGTLRCSKFDIFTDGQIESQVPFIISNRVGRLRYESQSEADMGFSTVAAVQFDGDAEKIDAAMRQSPLYRQKWERKDYREGTIAKAIASAAKVKANETPTLSAPEVPVVTPVSAPVVSTEDDNGIPAFDPTVINGIYKRVVDVATQGTTMAPQFVFAIAKTIVGAKMAGKVKFENLDVEPRFYSALIGETGSGKGLAWHRVFQILNSIGEIGTSAGIKISNSADSGAGIRDAFFRNPQDAPMLMYVDEVEGLGNKAAPTRNPAIVDAIIELADSTSISRTKADKKGDPFSGGKTKNDARLCAVLCGQDGHVYMKSFAGRTKLGLWDRFYPEYGVPVEPGDLPEVDRREAFGVMLELTKLDYSGVMTMAPEAKARLEQFWAEQDDATRKKARWKKHLMVDAFMSAFGRGLKCVELSDAEIAVKICRRQLVIRKVCFTDEVPDRTGFYIGLLKNITAKMEAQLKTGVHPALVAKSRRDFERETHAHRDNEIHLFERAWNVYSQSWLKRVDIEKANGQKYPKFLPADDE